MAALSISISLSLFACSAFKRVGDVIECVRIIFGDVKMFRFFYKNIIHMCKAVYDIFTFQLEIQAVTSCMLLG